MDSNKSKAILTIIEAGSLTDAAGKLGYTTSGISRLVASMEEEAGFPLLIRSRRGILPTKACQKLIPVFREMSYLGEKYTQTCGEIKGIEVGEITIGTSYRAYYPWLTKIISEFVQLYPEIKVHICDGNSSQLINMMETREIDCCIISQREGDFNWIELEENPIVAWLPKNHPQANAESIPLELFETEPYIDTYTHEDTDNKRMFKTNKIRPNICYSTTDNYATYSMVESGLGISLNNGLNSEGWKGNVIIKPLEPSQVVSIGMAYQTSNILVPAAVRFISYIKEQDKQ